MNGGGGGGVGVGFFQMCVLKRSFYLHCGSYFVAVVGWSGFGCGSSYNKIGIRSSQQIRESSLGECASWTSTPRTSICIPLRLAVQTGTRSWQTASKLPWQLVKTWSKQFPKQPCQIGHRLTGWLTAWLAGIRGWGLGIGYCRLGIGDLGSRITGISVESRDAGNLMRLLTPIALAVGSVGPLAIWPTVAFNVQFVSLLQ